MEQEIPSESNNNYSDQRQMYNNILSGPHKDPTSSFRPPILTRHISFYCPTEPRDPDEVENNKENESKRSSRSIILDNFFENTIKKIILLSEQFPKYDPKIRGIIRLFDENSQIKILGFNKIFNENGTEYEAINSSKISLPQRSTAGLIFYWNGIKSTIKFELHTEYITISTSLDLSEYKNYCEIKKNKFTAEIYKSFQNLAKFLKKSDGTENYNPITENILFGVWAEFDKKILSEFITDDNNGYTQTIKGQSWIIFADFRGIVLSQPHSGNEKLFQLPFWRKKSKEKNEYYSGHSVNLKKEIENPCFNPRFFPSEIEGICQSYWPFLCAPINGVSRDSYEYTVCSLHEGRVFYGSAIGATDLGKTNSRRMPVCYLMHAKNQVSSWQIGRLIDRMHRQGTLRAAAGIGFEELLQAMQDLRTAEINLTKTQTNVHSQASDESSSSLLKNLSLVQNSLISADSRLNTHNEKINFGPLQYRLERARYYVRKFREGVPRLRIERLEGFQPYDEFIERRLGSIFEFAEFSLERSKRILERRSTILQSCLAIEARKTGIELNNIQEKAEFALLLVIIPYYLSHIVQGVFEWHHKAFPYLVSISFSWACLVLMLWCRQTPRQPPEIESKNNCDIKTDGAQKRYNLKNRFDKFIKFRGWNWKNLWTSMTVFAVICTIIVYNKEKNELNISWFSEGENHRSEESSGENASLPPAKVEEGIGQLSHRTRLQNRVD